MMQLLVIGLLKAIRGKSLISKNTPTCENAVAYAPGSGLLQLMNEAEYLMKNYEE